MSVDRSLNELCENNRITEFEYNDSILLPFKYGAVSMAMKTNAKIVPFGVTGHYTKSTDDLIVRFSEPIDVNDYNTLEDANLVLRENVKKLIKIHK